MPNPSTYLLKITLKHIKPSIYRRVAVASDTKLAKLHQIIQVVMGWDNYHLHQFIKDKVFYGPDSDDFDSMCEPYTKLKVSDMLYMPKDKMVYEYDFGDGWLHEIQLEKILPDDAAMVVPFCMDGKRACPPEDCGGPWGYDDLCEALKNPEKPEAAELLEWLGDDFDPEYFDAEEINSLLVGLQPKPKKKPKS